METNASIRGERVGCQSTAGIGEVVFPVEKRKVLGEASSRTRLSFAKPSNPAVTQQKIMSNVQAASTF